MRVIATQHSLGVRQMADTARKLNSEIEIAVRKHNEDKSRLLRRDGAGMIFLGAGKPAKGMIQHIARRFASSAKSEHRQAGDAGQD